MMNTKEKIYDYVFYSILCDEGIDKRKLIELAFEWINGSPHYGFNDINWNGEDLYEQKCEKQKFSLIQSNDKKDFSNKIRKYR